MFIVITSILSGLVGTDGRRVDVLGGRDSGALTEGDKGGNTGELGVDREVGGPLR